MWADTRPLLEVHDLHDDPTAGRTLHGASLHVGDGEIVGVIGAARAGKSRLLAALCGLVPVSRGRVLFADRDITRLPAPELLRVAGITLVPQTSSLFPHMSVRENLELGLVRSRERAAARARVDAMFDRFPTLADLSRAAAGNLPLARQRLLELARALIWSPRMIVLDSLTGGLDSEDASALYSAVVQANTQDGVAALAAERAPRPLLEVCDRAYLVEDGRQTLDGTGAELLASRAVAGAVGPHTRPNECG